MAFKIYSGAMIRWFGWVLILMLGLSYSLIVQQWYMTSFLLFLLMVHGIYQIMKKIRATNERLANFFKMIFSGDANLRYPEKGLGLKNEVLNVELNRLAQKITYLEEQRRREESIYGAVVENLNIGVFILDLEGHLFLSNAVAKRFLNLRSTSDQEDWKNRAPYFYRQLEGLRKNPKVLVELSAQGETQKWQIKRRGLVLDDREFELFLVNNLQAELESKESEVTEKLMHTLTHEIMNSISPLTSLSETLQLQLSGFDTDLTEVKIPRETFEDIETTARVIQKRGNGLIEFVKRYSLLARLPRLNTERLDLEILLNELVLLMRDDLKKQGIELRAKVHGYVILRADKQLLLQVFINLIKNAAEAYGDGPKDIVEITARKGDGYNFISVLDKAGGIPVEMRDEIFLPFFSTKSKGSGIGLSISRKIIEAHHGRLYFRALTNGSEFVIELPD